MFDFSAALPTFLITLREGVEASLVVGIVLAYLKKINRTELYNWAFSGIGLGIGISCLVGIGFKALVYGFRATNPEVSPIFEPLLEGIFSVAAIAMLSWMLVWMTKQGKAVKGELEGSINQALGQGLGENSKAGWAILNLILFAILREGFEVSLFIAAKFEEGFFSAIGAVSGIIGAAIIGLALFKFGIKINLGAFFKLMGILLLLIVSGLVISALGHFDQVFTILAQTNPQSESLCFFYDYHGQDQFASQNSCILGAMVWDFSQLLPEKKFPGVVLHSLFGYQDQLFLGQAIAYLVFLAITATIYFKSISGQIYVAKIPGS